MTDREILIPAIDPLELFGPNNNKFKLICSKFPKLKIIARGNVIKAVGDPNELDAFADKMSLIFWHIEMYNHLHLNQLEKILDGGVQEVKMESNGDEVLVFGPGGHKVTARTANSAASAVGMSNFDNFFPPRTVSPASNS